MSDEEKEETERKKREGSRQGKQHVGTTNEAKKPHAEKLPSRTR